MATTVVYLLNTACTAPDWFGRVQDNGSAPAGALSAYGWTVAKVALTTPYWRGRIGATARATVAQAGSYIDGSAGPAKGTGNAATTAGDSYRSDNPLTGTYTAGNWVFTFGMRTGAASNSGRVRFNMWAAANIDGTGSQRKLNSAAGTLVGTAVTMSTTTTTYNSTVTWAAPQIVLNNEYVFLQPEWQSTVVGTSNSCTAQFYQCSFTTPNWAASYSMPAGTGALAFAGPDTNIDYDRVVTAATGARAFSFNAAVLKKGFVTQADPASFALTGIDVTLTKFSPLPNNYIMPADAGALALAGSATRLAVARKLAAAVRAFAFTGIDVGLRVIRRLPAAAGAFAFAGISVGLRAVRKLPVVVGTFVLSGAVTGLRAVRKLPAAVGAFALTGVATGLRAARRLAAVSGTVTLTGPAVVLRVPNKILAGTGAIALTGGAANLAVRRLLSAGTGELLLDGIDVNLTRGKFIGIMALPGSFVLSGKDVRMPVLYLKSMRPGPGALRLGRPVSHTMGRW